MTESAGILSGEEILKQIGAGRIRIDGYQPSYANPASIDLTLGKKVAVYRSAAYFVVGDKAFLGKEDVPTNAGKEPLNLDSPLISRYIHADAGGRLDSREKNEVWNFTMPESGWLLKPGIGYLMHTAEKIWTEDYVPVIDGKSSLGRLFMTAHVTAGYGDPGFDGQYTLEVVVTQPVVVYPGMRFCQIRFHTLVGELTDYGKRGHYTGAAAIGPVPSMSWKQFEEAGRGSSG